MKRPVVKTCRRDSYAKLAPLNRNLSTILRFKGVKRAWIQSSGWLWCDERKTEGASGNATSSRCLYPHRLPFCVSGTWPTVLVHRCPSNLSRSLFLFAFILSPLFASYLIENAISVGWSACYEDYDQTSLTVIRSRQLILSSSDD